MRTHFGIILVCASLSSMEKIPPYAHAIPTLRTRAAESIYQEFSAPDAEQRYSEQEAFDLIAHLKKHAVWDLVADKIPHNSSGEELYWTINKATRVPRFIARSAPCALYHDSVTGTMQYQSGSALRSLDSVCVKNTASWVLSDDGACAVGYGSYAGHEGLLYAELITGGIYPLELPCNELCVHAFIPTTHTLQLVSKSGFYEAPLSLLFQQGKEAWRIRMNNPGPSVETIIPLSHAQTILVAPHLLKSMNMQIRPPEGNSIEQAAVLAYTGSISYITRQSLRTNRAKMAHLWMMGERGARWNTEVDAAFPASITFSPDGRLIAVVTAQGNLALYTSAHGELLTTIEGLNAQQVFWGAYYFGVSGFGKGHRLTPTFAHYAAYSAQERVQKKERLEFQKLFSNRRLRGSIKK